MEVNTQMKNIPLALTPHHVLEDAVAAYLERVSNNSGDSRGVHNCHLQQYKPLEGICR